MRCTRKAWISLFGSGVQALNEALRFGLAEGPWQQLSSHHWLKGMLRDTRLLIVNAPGSCSVTLRAGRDPTKASAIRRSRISDGLVAETDDSSP